MGCVALDHLSLVYLASTFSSAANRYNAENSILFNISSKLFNYDDHDK